MAAMTMQADVVWNHPFVY